MFLWWTRGASTVEENDPLDGGCKSDDEIPNTMEDALREGIAGNEKWTDLSDTCLKMFVELCST